MVSLNLKQVGLVCFAVSSLAIFSNCSMDDKISTLRDTADVGYTGHIRLSLAHPFDVKKEDYEILLSTPFDVQSMAVCQIKEGAVCEAGSPSYFTTELTYATAARRFFKVEASALLEKDLTLQFMSYDRSGKAIDTRRVTFVAKAGTTPATSTSTGPTATTSPTPSAGGSTGASGDTQIKSVVQANCGGSTCHSGTYVANPASLKGTGAARMIEEGSMPKGRAMTSASDKAALLQYLK